MTGIEILPSHIPGRVAFLPPEIADHHYVVRKFLKLLSVHSAYLDDSQVRKRRDTALQDDRLPAIRQRAAEPIPVEPLLARVPEQVAGR